jgi:RHS repeat-associated protein
VRGRLRTLTRSGATYQFGYSPDGLRSSKTVNGAATAFLLDGDNIVKETTGGVSTDLLQGPGTDNLLQRGGKWFTPDLLGSTSTLTDGSGNLLQRYYYHPYGQTSPDPAPGDPQPYRFTGREDDGTGLMYYRARYYAPEWGRFISEDPIGFEGGINQYVYAHNNPIKSRDPSGQVAETPVDVALFGLSAYQYSQDPSLLNGISLFLDGLAVVTPFMPAVGQLVKRAVQAVTKVFRYDGAPRWFGKNNIAFGVWGRFREYYDEFVAWATHPDRNFKYYPFSGDPDYLENVPIDQQIIDAMEEADFIHFNMNHVNPEALLNYHQTWDGTFPGESSGNFFFWEYTYAVTHFPDKIVNW